MSKQITTLALVLGACAVFSARIGENKPLLQVDQFRKDFKQIEEKLWLQLDSDNNEISKEALPEVGIIKEFQDFGDVLAKEFPHDITYGLKSLDGSWVWARAYAELRTMYALYESFRRFQVQQTANGRIASPRQAWIDLVETILHDAKASVPDSSKALNELVTKEKLFRNVLKEINGDLHCNNQQSPQQMLLNLYNTVALTELKGYSMVQFSYMLLKLYDKGNFTKEAEIMKEDYEARSRTSMLAMKEALKMSSRDLWVCDPKNHVKGQTYVEITELLQGYVQNEVDLNPEGTCMESCSEYTYTKSHSCYKNLYCKTQRRCQGKIINCQFIDSDAWVCPAAEGSGRRYEYIEYENGRTLGRKVGCTRGTTKVDSWWRWLFWHCSYCVCLCDEQGPNSDRFINMRSAEADIGQNRVVTGLRFTKRNRIIHLQVQEGLLLARGTIEPMSVRWVPVENYKISDRNIFNEQDYHTLSWEKRAIDLDDLEAEEGYLVTGVRFKMIGSHLNFEIKITPFDFATGKLDAPKSIWKDNSNTDVSPLNPRKRLSVDKCDVPTRSLTPSVPDSRSDQYVEFTNTDFDRDAAQTTVPFIDIQPVESLLPVPLTGAGIYHKGINHFGGFIAPKIITYDFGKLIDNALDSVDADVAIN